MTCRWSSRAIVRDIRPLVSAGRADPLHRDSRVALFFPVFVRPVMSTEWSRAHYCETRGSRGCVAVADGCLLTRCVDVVLDGSRLKQLREPSRTRSGRR